MALKISHYVTRIQEGLFEGVCIIKLEGRLTIGEPSYAFHEYIQTRISGGMRFIVLDCEGVTILDSSGIGELVSALGRIQMRNGKLILVNYKTIEKYLLITKLMTVFEFADNLNAAIALCQGEAPATTPEIKFEEKFSIAIEEDKGKKKYVVDDKLSEEPARTEYRVREIPPQEEPKSLRPGWLVLVVLTSLATLAATVLGLVWVSKTVASITVLTLIFALALLFFILLCALVLLLSGHLSEKAAAKLFGGVLGKIPGLGAWLPKPSKR